jgi:hypothetical protein
MKGVAFVELGSQFDAWKQVGQPHRSHDVPATQGFDGHAIAIGVGEVGGGRSFGGPCLNCCRDRAHRPRESCEHICSGAGLNCGFNQPASVRHELLC